MLYTLLLLILLYIVQVVSFFCLKIRITITSEPIWFSDFCRLQAGPVMVLGYFVIRFNSSDGFILFLALFAPLNTESLDARGVAASYF